MIRAQVRLEAITSGARALFRGFRERRSSTELPPWCQNAPSLSPQPSVMLTRAIGAENGEGSRHGACLRRPESRSERGTDRSPPATPTCDGPGTPSADGLAVSLVPGSQGIHRATLFPERLRVHARFGGRKQPIGYFTIAWVVLCRIFVARTASGMRSRSRES